MLKEELLDVYAENAADCLRNNFADFESGRIDRVKHIHGFAALFRQRGVCQLLMEGTARPLFIAQQQAASAYLYRLPSIPYDEQVTSLAGVFWDAVGGEYRLPAEAIARGSRSTWNPKREHEENFLYVMFLMKRYAMAANEAEQVDLLDRWEFVIEGQADPQLDLCRALLGRNEKEIVDGIMDLGEARIADMERKIEKGALDKDISVWFRPYWNEGLALTRLAQRDGVRVPDSIPRIPDIARSPCPFEYSPDAWRQVDFQPSLKT